MGCDLSPRTAQGCPLGPPAPGPTSALATRTPESAGRLGATGRRRRGARVAMPGGALGKPQGGKPQRGLQRDRVAQRMPGSGRSKGKPLPCAPEPPIVPSTPTPPAPGRTERARKGLGAAVPAAPGTRRPARATRARSAPAGRTWCRAGGAPAPPPPAAQRDVTARPARPAPPRLATRKRARPDPPRSAWTRSVLGGPWGGPGR